MSHPLPPKKEVALALLERSSVHVHLDPRAAGVVVPLFLKSQPQLVLQIGLNMPVPIPDLRLDEAGMTCTLSFNRSPFYCVIPWSSVFAMIGDDGRGMIWKDDVPAEVAKPSQARPDRPATPPAEITDRPMRVAPPPPPSAGDVAQVAAGGARDRDRDVSASAGAKAKTKKPRKRVERTKESPAARGGGPAREGRGGLTAVPSAPNESAGTDRTERERPARKSAREREGVTEKRPRPAPAARQETPPEPPPPPQGARPAPRRPGGPPKPKRELPPYLRVVK